MSQLTMTFSDADLREKTDEWIKEHPSVYELFVKFAKELAGRDRQFGIGFLAERVRWECVFQYDEKDWKINNNYRAYIARRLIQDYPELAPFIEFRKTKW